MNDDLKSWCTTQAEFADELERVLQTLVTVTSDLSPPGRAMFWLGWLTSTSFHVTVQSLGDTLTPKEHGALIPLIKKILDESLRLCNRAAQEDVTTVPSNEEIQ